MKPSVGPPAGATVVTVLGENFEESDVVCFFGKKSVAAAFESSSMVRTLRVEDLWFSDWGFGVEDQGDVRDWGLELR